MLCENGQVSKRDLGHLYQEKLGCMTAANARCHQQSLCKLRIECQESFPAMQRKYESWGKEIICSTVGSDALGEGEASLLGGHWLPTSRSLTWTCASLEILELTRLSMKSSLLSYLTYLSCCFRPAWLDWQRISPACWTPLVGLAFHPIPELSLAPWRKLSHDGLPSPCFPALVVVQCCDFWSSAHLVVLQSTRVGFVRACLTAANIR